MHVETHVLQPELFLEQGLSLVQAAELVDLVLVLAPDFGIFGAHGSLILGGKLSWI
jgi:hypothetical protein